MGDSQSVGSYRLAGETGETTSNVLPTRDDGDELSYWSLPLSAIQSKQQSDSNAPRSLSPVGSTSGDEGQPPTDTNSRNANASMGSKRFSRRQRSFLDNKQVSSRSVCLQPTLYF